MHKLQTPQTTGSVLPVNDVEYTLIISIVLVQFRSMNVLHSEKKAVCTALKNVVEPVAMSGHYISYCTQVKVCHLIKYSLQH